MKRPCSQLFIVFIASVYCAIALFGMSVFIMPSEQGGMMGGGCPLMRDTGALCEAGILEHITHWNILFSATFTIIVVLAAAVFATQRSARVLVNSPPHERYRRYIKDTPHVRLFQATIRLFSDGILQPKIFA
jgi:hypothetical protein